MNHATYKLSVERVRLERLRRKIDKQLMQINRAIQLLEYDSLPIDDILEPLNLELPDEDEIALLEPLPGGVVNW